MASTAVFEAQAAAAADGVGDDLLVDDDTLDTMMTDDGDDGEDGDEVGAEGGEPQAKRSKKTKGRVKIKMEFIENKLRRYTTFSKRKTGIMKKAYELSTLTGTQIMLLVASETGHVYTFATPKLQPMITSESGKALIQTCLNTPDPSADEETESTSRMVSTGYEETELQYLAETDEDGKPLSPTEEGYEERIGMAPATHHHIQPSSAAQGSADRREPSAYPRTTATILPMPTAVSGGSSMSSAAAAMPSQGVHNGKNRHVASEGSFPPNALAPLSSTSAGPQFLPQLSTSSNRQHGNVLIASSSVPHADVLNSSRTILLPSQGQIFSTSQTEDGQQIVYRQS